MGTRSASVTPSSSSTSTARTQPHDTEKSERSDSRQTESSHTSVNDEDSCQSDQEDNRRKQNCLSSLVSRPIEVTVSKAQKDKEPCGHSKEAEEAKSSVIVSTGALESTTSKPTETDSAIDSLISSPSRLQVPPPMNNAAVQKNEMVTVLSTCQTASPSTSSSTSSCHRQSNRTNDLEQSRSSNCDEEDEPESDADSRTECSDKQSISDNNTIAQCRSNSLLKAEEEQENGTDESLHGHNGIKTLKRPTPTPEEDINEEDDDDDQQDDFDPTEVFKRMKVELKEEFDEEEDVTDNGAIGRAAGHKQMMSLIRGQQQRANLENNSSKNNFIRNLFGGNASSMPLATAGFDQSATIEYFRKIFADTLANHFASKPVTEGPAQKPSSSSSENSHPSIPEAALPSQLAAFAGTSSAPKVSINASDSLILNEGKKQLIEALLLKQLNGDLDGPLDVESILQQQMARPTASMASNITSNGAPLQQSLQPQQPVDDPQERYCTSCSIQFISGKTFKVCVHFQSEP